MSDVRWCFTHKRATWTQRFGGVSMEMCGANAMSLDCDVRDAVVLPKGDYYTVSVAGKPLTTVLSVNELLLSGVLRKVEG